jgi:hypothetical protein
MSETTEATVIVEASATSTAPVAPTTAEQALAIAAKQGAQDKAEREEHDKECRKILNSITSTFKRGSRLHAKAMLRVGLLCDRYVHGRMALGDKRAVAVQAITGRLAEVSGSEDVRVNALISTYHAWRILAADRGLDALGSDKGADKGASAVPYSHFREVYSRLIERVDTDKISESYRLSKDVSDAKAYDLFDECCAAKLSRGACLEKVQALLGIAPKATEAPKAPQAPELSQEPELPQAPATCKQPTLHDIAGSNVNDVADSISELFKHSDAPDDLLTATMLALLDNKEMSRVAHRAIQAALIILERGEKAPAAPQTPELPQAPAAIEAPAA